MAMVEREAYCVAHLEAKMRSGELDEAPIYPDLHGFPWGKYRGLVDLVSGGFPCQPFSSAGKRESTEDPRHLWPVIRAGLALLRPHACFFENVDGIASAKSPGYHSVLHNVLVDLEELDFRATAGCFTASEVGAPHRRRRWFILGVADGDGGRREGLSTTRIHNGQQSPGDDTLGRSSEEPEVADADGLGHQERSRGVGSQSEDDPVEDGGFVEVADSDIGGGVQGVELSELRSSESRESSGDRRDTEEGEELVERYEWPSGPTQAQMAWEARRVIERRVGGSTNGLPDELERCPNRRDRLRALGNAVVPQTAARAFSTLWYELNP